MLVQAAAGGVGLYLVQLLAARGVTRVTALASSQEKMRLVKGLGVETVIDYSAPGWAEEVRARFPEGVDVVLEAASGEVGRESFRLLAPFGRMVMFGSRNIHETLEPEQLRQLITRNQALIGFNIPSLQRDKIAACVPKLLRLIAEGRLKLFAENVFLLEDIRRAFAALASRETIGKVVVMIRHGFTQIHAD